MKLTKIIPASVLGLCALLSGPALAISSIADVPSLWPADEAFVEPDATPVISTKNVTEADPVDVVPETKDR